MTRFDSEIASELGRETYAPLSDAGNRPPRVFFEVDREHPTRMTACPPGALITCLMCEDTSVVRIETTEHRHIADVTVRTGDHVGHDDLTTEAVAIASALYWSWWRAMDMRGEAPGKKLTGWSASVMTHVTRHGAVVVTIDEGQATVMFRQQVEGACIEHEILSDAGETSMSVAEAIRVSDELVEDLDAGRMFDRSYGRRA